MHRTAFASLSTLLAVIALGPRPAGAQELPACYVPDVGALYVVGMEGAPAECLSGGHVPVVLLTSLEDALLGTLDGNPMDIRLGDTHAVRIRRVGSPNVPDPIGVLGIGTDEPTTPLHVAGYQGALRVHPIFTELAGTTLLGSWESETYEPQVRYDGPATGWFDVGLDGLGDYVIEESDLPRVIVQRSGNGSAILISDRSGGTFDAAIDNEFAVRAVGGIHLRTSADLTTGCNLGGGSGTWECTSSRSAKTDEGPADPETVLAGITTLAIGYWTYRADAAGALHLGPFAEDFHAAFGVGSGPETISSVDADAVALLGIQALEARARRLEAENAELRARLDRLEALLDPNRTAR